MPLSQAAATRLRASPRATPLPNVVQAPKDSADSTSPETPSLRYSIVNDSICCPGRQSTRAAALCSAGGQGGHGSLRANAGSFGDMLRQLMAPPGAGMRDLAARGDRLVARIRLLLPVLGLPLPLLAAASGAG